MIGLGSDKNLIFVFISIETARFKSPGHKNDLCLLRNTLYFRLCIFYFGYFSGWPATFQSFRRAHNFQPLPNSSAVPVPVPNSAKQLKMTNCRDRADFLKMSTELRLQQVEYLFKNILIFVYAGCWIFISFQEKITLYCFIKFETHLKLSY